jgi:uncharacterized protein (DUF1800 family)
MFPGDEGDVVMDRRQFLSALLGAQPAGFGAGSGPAARDAAFASFANTALPARKAQSVGLEPYQGEWTRQEASHLLRRCLFGFSQSELDTVVGIGVSAAVDALLVSGVAPTPPLVTSAKETTIAIGSSWVDQPYNGDLSYDRSRNLQAWWMGLLLGQAPTIREKMTLFWHNHFAFEWRTVGEPHHTYFHLQKLRENALGNFKELARMITIDPAMLRYLNGNTNTKSNPNENYARELQELFTIGKGPEIAPGNYTNYTEDDVKAAAKVLTGWRDLRDNRNAEFRPNQHDTTDKTFSSAYGGTVIKGRTGAEGATEIDDLIEMIFSQTETARHLCRELYRYFVYYVVDDDVETHVVRPLADLLIGSAWEIAPVLSSLLKSAHFQDVSNRGCFIKTPLDLVVGSLRSLGSSLPTANDLPLQYQVWLTLVDQASNMQMELLEPPNVAGWPAFHQDPVYYQAWISSDTLPRRVQYTDRCLGTKGYQIGTWYLLPDLVGLANSSATDPSDLAALVNGLALRLFPIPITDSQNTYLQSVVLAGAPAYEWPNNWAAHTASPADATKKSVVETRLRNLLKAMMAMAEHQLC